LAALTARALAVAALAWLAPAVGLCTAAGAVVFSEEETRAIVAHGPWPPDWRPDASNRASGTPAGIAYGRALFFDTRLSASGRVSCATCHAPARGWTDGRRLGRGATRLERNTPSVVDTRFARWLGRDGAGDSLWSHALKPLTDPREMGADFARVAALVRTDARLRACHAASFGAVAGDDEVAAVEVAKALAAFQESLVSPRTAFDAFRDALLRGDRVGVARYPETAKRGLRLFVGRGNCTVCHHGPTFTNGEFADIGVPFFLAPGRVDPGRHAGIAAVLASRYNRLGPFNDAADDPRATATAHLAREHRHWGEFKVPGLRGLAHTAPYMHAGSHATLNAVVQHYSRLNEERLHVDGERILRPLRLNARERADLEAFLRTLGAPPPAGPRGARRCEAPRPAGAPG
jgi:cytochrome c peroxidase